MNLQEAREVINKETSDELRVVWLIEDIVNLEGKLISFYGAQIIYCGVRIKSFPVECELEDLTNDILSDIIGIKSRGIDSYLGR